MKRVTIPLLAALLSLPVAAYAQTTTLPAPTDAQRERAMQLVQLCANTDEEGKYYYGSCYGQHVDSGIKAIKQQNWSKAIAEETDAITILTVYPDKVRNDLGRDAPGYQQAQMIAYLFRSLAYEHTQQYNLAIADATQAIAFSPADPNPWNQRCWVRAVAGDLANAQSDCQKSLQLGPQNAAILDSAGFVYLKQKNYPAAITNYQAALKITPKLASSLYGLGLAEQAQGNQAEATQSIAAAQQIDPKITTDFGT